MRTLSKLGRIRWVDAMLCFVSNAGGRSPHFVKWLRNHNFIHKKSIVSRILPACLPREVTVDCGGILMKLDLEDAIQRYIYFSVHEQADLACVLPLIPVRGVCIDAGAKVGFLTLQFARRVGEQGAVHSFEPDPRTIDRLRLNCSLNSCGSVVHAHCLAVSNCSGTIEFHRGDATQSAWGSLVEPRKASVERIPVQTTNLDCFLRENNIDLVPSTISTNLLFAPTPCGNGCA